MSNWVQKLINKEYDKFELTVKQLKTLKKAVDNTMGASWAELVLVETFGEEAGGIIYNEKVYTYRKYKSKLYCLTNENTSTNLQS